MLYQQAGPVHPAPQTALTAVDEVDAVVLNVKAHEVTAEDALEDDVAPGEDLDHVPGGEGDVEEEAELAGQPFLFCHLADRFRIIFYMSFNLINKKSIHFNDQLISFRNKICK
jgi:hypothetical protein